MNVILHQWLKSKKACALVVISLIARGVEAVVEAEWMVLIPAILSSGNVKPYVTTFVLVSVFGVLSSAVREIAMKHSMRMYYTRVFNDYTKHILQVDYRFFTKYSNSKLTSVQKFINDTADIGKDVQVLVGFVIADVVYLIRMYQVGGWIVLPIIGLGIILMALMYPLYKMHGKLSKKADDIFTRRNQTFENVINGFREVRLFNRQQSTLKAIEDDNAEINHIGVKRGFMTAGITALVSSMDKVVNIVICLVGVGLIATGVWSVADGIAVASLASSILWNLLNIADFVDDLGSAKGMSDQFEEVMSYQIPETLEKVKIERFERSLELTDVHFQFGDTREVLSGVNMVIYPKERIGICGKSGGGKTTLLNLLTKFYSPTDGWISIDDVDLDYIDSESYYHLIGVVSQDPVVFPGSIMENLLYGKPKATEYEVIEAAKKAQIYEFIRALPEGFETDIGPNGIKLSGGQKQRLALARMIVTDPSIIILDEATSALDNETEKLVQEVIGSMKDKTVITVAHRLSTIQDSDRIYVIDQGRCVEGGDHETLMNLNGVYALMYNAKEEC